MPGNESPAVQYAMERFHKKLAEVDRDELNEIAKHCSSDCRRWCIHKLARQVLSLMPDPFDVDDETLRPCPFCGGEPVHEVADDGTNNGGHFIRCKQCNASTTVVFPIKDSVDGIIRSYWNNRA